MAERNRASEQISRMSDPDLNRMILDLTYYTVWRLRLFEALGGTLDSLPAKGTEFGDYVENIVLRALGDINRWIPRRIPILLDWLKEKVDRMTTDREEAVIINLVTTEELDELPGRYLDPAVVIEARDFFEKLQKRAQEKNDEEVVQILRCIENGIFEPRKIAIATRMDIRQVNNAQRRLRRMVIELSKEEGIEKTGGQKNCG